jgi:hypothetical protein
MNIPEGATFVDRKDKVTWGLRKFYSWFHHDERRHWSQIWIVTRT